MMTFAILGVIAFLGMSLIPVYILRRWEYTERENTSLLRNIVPRRRTE